MFFRGGGGWGRWCSAYQNMHQTSALEVQSMFPYNPDYGGRGEVCN
jgi:hypothetical protein